MSAAALSRIEKTLKDLSAQQAEICAAIAKLEERIDAPAEEGVPRSELFRFLDGFRAAEGLGEASVGAWIEVCHTDCLKGGLRTVREREGMHARLLEARLVELGGTPRIEIPADRVEKTMKAVGSADRSDAQKLLDFTKRTSDPDQAISAILQMADRLDADPETQSLLRAIAQDERSTVVLLNEACALLNAN